MTFQFHNWPAGAPTDFTPRKHRRCRPRLVAQWRVGGDGRLECRWVRGSFPAEILD